MQSWGAVKVKGPKPLRTLAKLLPAGAKTQGAVQAALKSGVIQEIILNRPDSFQLQDMV